MRYGRVDTNQSTIVGVLHDLPGVRVRSLSDVGGGFPDLVIGYKNVNYLVELKAGSKLTDAQDEFHETWTGQKAVCNSLEEVLELIGIKYG